MGLNENPPGFILLLVVGNKSGCYYLLAENNLVLNFTYAFDFL
jgi:hypothetical protein